MSSISKPNTFTANTTASSSEVNDNFDTIYNDYNGNIDADNLADGAVTEAKIADGAVTSDKLASGIIDSGWALLSGTHSVSTGYNAGNRSFTVSTSADHSGTISEGMRYKVTRSTTPPTQCADLEASSSHYAKLTGASVNGITFTDDFTCEAWVKLESYTTSANIISRYTTTGFQFRINSDGTVGIYGNGGAVDSAVSYQSIPLGKWVHVAASLDMSGTSGLIYIDGVLVPSAYTNGASSSITQAGDLELGSYNGGTTPFDGKISDVRVWSDIRTATEIQDNMFGYPSDTTNLVAHFKLNGDFTDDSSNGNDLTAQNSAVATNSDNPWNATEYGVVTAVTSSTITVFCPSGYGIPLETLSAPYYSTQDTPFGFPRDKGKWRVNSMLRTTNATTSNATYGSYISGGWKLTVPVGAWDVGWRAILTNNTTVTVAFNISSTALTGLDFAAGHNASPYAQSAKASAAANTTFPSFVSQPENQTTAKTYVMYTVGATTGAAVDATSIGLAEIFAECAYI